MYRLSFLQEAFPFQDKVRLHQAKFTTANTLQFYSYYEKKLHCFYNDGSSWQTFSINSELLSGTHEIYFDDLFGTGQDILVSRSVEGIKFFQFQDNILKLINEVNEFHDVYGWSDNGNYIKFGHFYNDKTLLGLLTKHNVDGIQFYAVMKDEMFSDESPIWPLDTNLNILPNNQSKLYLSPLVNFQQDNIIVRSVVGLDVYEFNKQNLLEKLFSIHCCNNISDPNDELLFGNVTGSKYQDLINFNSTGLYLYNYDISMKIYRFLDYHPMFSAQKGWTRDHTNTVRLFDINFDGTQEMIFTGPQGVSILEFDYYRSHWHSLLDNSQIGIEERNGKVVHVIDGTGDPNMLIFFHNVLHWASVEQVQNTPYEISQLDDNKPPVNEPPLVFQISEMPKDKNILYLRDQLVFSSKFEAVDKSSGKLKFSLPLVDIPNLLINLKINYDGITTGMLGFGWTMYENLIMLDHQSSVFEEDRKYYIIHQQTIQELIINSNNSTSNVSFFSLQDASAKAPSNSTIVYYKDDEHWELNISGIKQIYGKISFLNSEPVKTESTWKYWRGPGNSTEDQVHLPVAWYLSEITDDHKNTIHFSYQQICSTYGVDTCYKQVYLKEMADGEGNSISFKYGKTDAKLLKMKSNLISQFPLHLTGYILNTAEYTQEIDLIYKIENDKLLLSEIIQKNDQPALQFFYNNEDLLKKVIFPLGSSLEFIYKSIDVPQISNIKKFTVYKDYKVHYGNDFVIFSYVNSSGHLEIKMFNQQMTQEMYSTSSDSFKTRLPLLLGTNCIKMHQVVDGRNFIAFILWHSSGLQIYLFHVEHGNLTLIPTNYTYSVDCTIRFGADFIVAVDNNSPAVLIEWDKMTKQWKKLVLDESKPSISIATYGRMFVTYDDRHLVIWYRDGNEKWQSKMLKYLPNLLTNIKQSLSRFNLDKEVRDQLYSESRNRILQFSNNIVMVNSWAAERTRLFSEIYLFVLDSNYEIAIVKKVDIPQDDISNYSREITDEKGNKFVLHYIIEAEKYKFTVKDFKGPLREEIEVKKSEAKEEIDRSGLPWRKKHKMRTELNQKVKETEDGIKKTVEERWGRKLFLLDSRKYIGFLASQVAVCGNYRIEFTGSQWNVIKINKTSEVREIRLGNDFILNKESEKSTIKLYRQNSENNEKGDYILDLKVKQINELLMNYPNYIAYQEKNQPAQIIQFSNEPGAFKTYELPLGEKITNWSREQDLITVIEMESKNGHYLVHRSMARQLQSYSAISQILLTSEEKVKRLTGYEYDIHSAVPLATSIFYKETITIPGNDKKSFGWIQETLHDNHTSKTIFNGQGKIVKTSHLDYTPENNEETEETVNRNTTIFDKYGKLPVAQFFPYEKDSGIVSFYGFEDYEINENQKPTLRGETQWLFSKPNIIRNRFSFTGENYLLLNSGETLKGTFIFSKKNMTFVASAWVRPQFEMPPVGSVTPFLKIIASSENEENGVGTLSEIKLQSGGWYYLESIINLQYITLNINSKPNTNSSTIPNASIKLAVIISPESNSTVHVDHVRFSPLNCRYKALIYHTSTKCVREEVQFNGLVKRYIYDKYREKIATVNEFGQLTEFSTNSKVSSAGAIQQTPSVIQFHSESGSYEDFSPDFFYQHWNVDDPSVFQISPSHIKHVSQNANHLQLLSNGLNRKSFALRLLYTLYSAKSHLKFDNLIKLERQDEAAYINISNKEIMAPIQGELVILVESNRLFLWIDGGLYFDEGNITLSTSDDNSLMNIEVNNEVLLKEIMVLSSVNVMVTYFNGLGEKIQEVKLEDESNVVVTGFLYDEIGRQGIITKPIRITRSSSDHILSYNSKLVVNGDPYSKQSVWETGRLRGDISVFGEYVYSRIKYNNNPMEEERVLGYPGEDFSISGPFAKRYDYYTDLNFIKVYFPESQGFKYRTEHKPAGVSEVNVFDRHDNQVARYVHVPNSRDLLSTYEYDNKNRLVKLLPPMYHERAGTLYKPYPDLHSLSEVEKLLQKCLGTHITYDSKGNILAKTTPDSGKVENIYDSDGQLKFVVYYSQDNDTQVAKVLYFNYDEFLRLSSTGLIEPPPPVHRLLNTIHNNTRKYQEFYYNDADADAILRGTVRRSITYNDGVPFVEELQLNDQQQGVNKRLLFPGKEDDTLFVEISKRFSSGKLREVKYPVEFEKQPFILTYEYNKLGEISEIGFPDKSFIFFSYTYNPSGQVVSESHFPGTTHNFTRYFSYNSPGYLERITDKFLTEEIFYTEPGYGGYGYGDGTITRTQFSATWHNYSRIASMKLNEDSFVSKSINADESKMCFNKLKLANYIEDWNQQTKVYYPDIEVNMPGACSYGTTGRHIAYTLGKRGFPKQYGHIYDYGNHLELTKAKYFIGENLPTPLQPDTFAKEIPSLMNNISASRTIWKNLKKFRYIIEDHDKINFGNAHAKRGIPIFKARMEDDLKSMSPHYRKHLSNLAKLLCARFSTRQPLSLSDFIKVFSSWQSRFSIGHMEVMATDIYNMLHKNNYLQNPLSDEFRSSLKDYESVLPDLVKVLLEHFATELGQAEFDVESYGIDSNGNHKHYYTGFDRYEISYVNNTNRIDAVKFKSFAVSMPTQSFLMVHDSRGNVMQALHKGIRRIHYDPVLDRASKILLTDGRLLTFSYDSQGERIFKKIENSRGETLKEIHYIRDDLGRSLVERELTFVTPDKPPVILVTAYIYGPRGLVGFIRRDELYSVISDHENSIRLVIKSGEVVAAYDYLPYGNLMREFASYPEAHVIYRYTGQEWDEELGLYNFHARLYDPSIGRFYQIDPKEQYFSPYKYAGNSPISLIDPNGEFAFLISLLVAGIAGLVGAYLGGSAANNTFNIAKWNWKSAKTWGGIIQGFIGGAFLPTGFSASVAALGAIGLSQGAAVAVTATAGLVGAYVNAAAANDDWNPTRWDFSSPHTYKGGFTGFGVGSGFFAGIRSAHNTYTQLSKVGKGFFIAGSVTTGLALFTLQGFSSNWDLSKPGFWAGVIDAASSATDLPMILRHFGTAIAKSGRKVFTNYKNLQLLKLKKLERTHSAFYLVSKNQWRIKKFMAALKVLSGFVTVGFTTYLAGADANDDFENWDMSSVGTYQALVQGFLSGLQTTTTVRGSFDTYKKTRKVKLGKKAKEISDNVAKNTIEEYKTFLEVISYKLGFKKKTELKIPEETLRIYESMVQKIDLSKYSRKTVKRLIQSRIPNTAVAVGISKNLIITSFSTNNAPGLVMVFTHKKLNSPTFLHKKLLAHNDEVGGKPVALSDDSAFNEHLMTRIYETQEGIIQQRVKQFESEGDLYRSYLNECPHMNEVVKDIIIRNIKNVITENGFIVGGKRAIRKEFNTYFKDVISRETSGLKEYIQKETKVLLEKMNEMTVLKEDIYKRNDLYMKKMYEQKNVDSPTDIQFMPSKARQMQDTLALLHIIDPSYKKTYDSLSIEIQELKKKANYLKRQANSIEAEMRARRDDVVNNMWTHLKNYEKDFPSWSPVNCAVPHVISAFNRQDGILSEITTAYSDKAKDIKYLATYKIRDVLRPFELCDQCKITASSVRNIITDPEWSEVLNNLAASSKQPLESAKQNIHRSERALVDLNGASRSLPFFRPSGPYDHNNTFTRRIRSVSEEIVPEKVTSGASRNLPFFRPSGPYDHNNTFTRLIRSVSEEIVPEKVTSGASRSLPFFRPSGPYDHNNTFTRRIRSVSEEIVSEKVTSGASRSLPFFTSLFGWIKETYNNYLSNLVNRMNEEIPSELPTNSEGTFSNSNTSPTRLTSFIDLQGSVLLANVIVAKLMNTRLRFTTTNQSYSHQDALAYALNITDWFENKITYTGTEFGLPIDLLFVDFIDVQNRLIEKIMSNKLHEIASLLNSYLEGTVLISNSLQSLGVNREKFLRRMNNYIEKYTNRLIQNILERGGQTVRTVYREDQRRLKLNAMMCNTKVKSLDCSPGDARYLPVIYKNG